MLIICPNCGARYAVDPSALQAPGRDVQCSACGHGWFHPVPEADEDGAGPASDPQPDGPTGHTPQPDDDTVSRASAATADLRQAVAATTAAPPGGASVGPAVHSPQGDGGIARPGSDTGHGAAPPRTGEGALAPDTNPARPPAPPAGEASAAEASTPPRLDPRVEQILREEAQRELQSRRAEASTLEVQTDLGLPDGGARRVSARRVTTAQTAVRPADPGTGDVSAAPAAADTNDDGAIPDPSARPGQRQSAARRRLPDIDQIGDRLADGPAHAATGDYPDERSMHRARSRAGYRLGFFAVVGTTMVAMGLYLGAPQLAALMPSAEPWLTLYVIQIDDWRAGFAIWLDDGLRGLTALISPQR